MMYNNKMVVAVKANGKILREFKDIVRIPFGSEYSLLIKNLHNVRAQVSVEIDGQDVLDGRALVANPNSEVELTRFVNDLHSGNALKFIERTAGIEQHRGIKLDDGIIRVSWKYELPNQVDYLISKHSYLRSRRVNFSANNISGDMGNIGPSGPQGYYSGNVMYCADPSNTQFLGNAEPMHDAMAACDIGITVPGSINNQKFSVVSSFRTEAEEHVMVIRLSGYVDGQEVVQPITVKTKPTCISCGRVNKATSKFCSECGTALTII